MSLAPILRLSPAMKPLTLPIHAQHLHKGEAHALLLDENAPQQHLRLALITRGAERHIFPALALDDWGREKKGPGLHRWLYEQGPRFPRAELFGYDAHGDETQTFLRDLELSFRFPCYLFTQEGEPIPSGVRLQAIFLSGDYTSVAPRETEPPPHLPFPLRRAAVQWRLVGPASLPDLGWQTAS